MMELTSLILSFYHRTAVLEYLTILTPVVLILVIYFVRLERRLAKITTDICWIKQSIAHAPHAIEK